MGQTDARVLTEIPVRDAATVIVLRQIADRPNVLMGQRGKSAAFMPSKFVFPGGAVDAEDALVPLARAPSAELDRALSAQSRVTPAALIAAATRELWEETGLLLGRPNDRAAKITAPKAWHSYLATGHLPDAAPFRGVVRAITPPGQPRRFDARFVMVDAMHLLNNADDFSGAEDELSHLQWVPLGQAREIDMPFITEVVLAELAAVIEGRAHPGLPFFDNRTNDGRFERL